MFQEIIKRIILIARVVLVLILLLLLLLPIIKAPSNALRNASLQQARVERIAKDVLILEYRPTSEHSQAVSELQDTLPVWQQEQTSLATFNDAQVQLLLLQSQSDYTPMTAALQKILATPTSQIDPVQVSIILQHEHDYAVTLNQIAMLIQQDSTSVTTQFFVFSLSALALSIILAIVNQIIARKEQPDGSDSHPSGNSANPGSV